MLFRSLAARERGPCVPLLFAFPRVSSPLFVQPVSLTQGSNHPMVARAKRLGRCFREAAYDSHLDVFAILSLTLCGPWTPPVEHAHDYVTSRRPIPSVPVPAPRSCDFMMLAAPRQSLPHAALATHTHKRWSSQKLPTAGSQE